MKTKLTFAFFVAAFAFTSCTTETVAPLKPAGRASIAADSVKMARPSAVGTKADDQLFNEPSGDEIKPAEVGSFPGMQPTPLNPPAVPVYPRSKGVVSKQNIEENQ